MIHILARWCAKDGKHSEVLGFIHEMKTESRKEPGNRRYDIYQNVEDPHQFLLDELYDSEEAVQLHRGSDHFKNIVEGKISSLLASRKSEKKTIEA